LDYCRQRPTLAGASPQDGVRGTRDDDPISIIVYGAPKREECTGARRPREKGDAQTERNTAASRRKELACPFIFGVKGYTGGMGDGMGRATKTLFTSNTTQRHHSNSPFALLNK